MILMILKVNETFRETRSNFNLIEIPFVIIMPFNDAA